MNQNNRLMLTWGFFLGGLLIVTNLLLYALSKPLFTGSAWATFLSFVLNLVFIYTVTKKGVDLQIDFRTVLRIGFAVFLLGNALFYAFEYLMYNHWDTSLVEIQKKEMIAFFTRDTKPDLVAAQSESIMAEQYHTAKATILAFAQRSILWFAVTLGCTYLNFRAGE